jgi:hypothetical protein
MALMIVLVLLFSAINTLTLLCHYCKTTSVDGSVTSCLVCNSILYGLQWLCCLAYVLEVGKILKFLGELCEDANACDSDLCLFIQAFCSLSYMYICFLALSPMFYVAMGIVGKKTNALHNVAPLMVLPMQGIQMGYTNSNQSSYYGNQSNNVSNFGK